MKRTYIEFKAPKARKAESFIVYPFIQGATTIALQSDNRYMIVNLVTNSLTYSKRIAGGAYSIHCNEFMGALTIPIPDDLKASIDKVVENNTATTKVVSLCG